MFLSGHGALPQNAQVAARFRHERGDAVRSSKAVRSPPRPDPAGSVSIAPASAAAGGRAERAPPRISDLLWTLVETWPRERFSLGDLVAALGDRGYAILMLVLALPNLTPIPLPVLSALFGLPLACIALQMAVGRPRPWLPQWALRRSIARADFARLVALSLPRLRRLERLMRPRWSSLSSRPAERFLGLVCLVLALLLALPIPFTNIALSIPLCLIALGILERDGAWILAGLAASLASGGLAFWLGWALIKGALLLLHGSLGL
jgi:hypothetical protein